MFEFFPFDFTSFGVPQFTRRCARLPRIGAAAATPVAILLAALAQFWVASLAHAGVLQEADLRGRFPAPYIVGEKSTDVPVWPIFKPNGPTTDLVGYVFESIDLAPIPGFSGTPVDLLVGLNPEGEFFDVAVLSQHEPVFVDGLGPEPLFRFVSQYKGLSLKQNIKIGSAKDRAGANVVIDGVAKATASVRIINQTMLASALKVARAKLHVAGGHDPDQAARVRADVFAALDWDALHAAGLVYRLQLRQEEVEKAFAGSSAAHHPGDSEGQTPEERFIDLHAAFVDIPSAGRNLLDDAALAQIHARSQGDDHVLLLMANGAYPFLGEDHVRGSVPNRLGLFQDGLPIELRDMDLDPAPRGTPGFALVKVFRVIGAEGLDLGRPVELRLHVTRSVGIVFPERVARDFTLKIETPEDYLIAPARDEKTWLAIWRTRWIEIAALGAALAVLTAALLLRPAFISRSAPLRRFRLGFLAFTLVFIGWYAQGQLSIVNLIALLDATRRGDSWTFFLYDPMSTLLWVYTLASLVVWGRGTFCGWLCPFGALQELAAWIGRRLRVRPRHVTLGRDRALKRLKYLILALIVGASFVSTSLTDSLVELEPFKTAITLGFERALLFVAYAVGLVALGVVVNKFFCRYLCPLGAALSLMGRLRRWDWIARRAECGTPCQTCRHRCDYQAIDASGRIDYAECFQCMDCVAIYSSDTECAPRILAAKGRAPLAINVAPAPVAPKPEPST